MSSYNLIRNSIFTSPTDSGTGNKSLTYNELKSLYDVNTTSSGVSLTSSDVLYLDIDLGDRIKLDSVVIWAYLSNDTIYNEDNIYAGFADFGWNQTLVNYLVCLDNKPTLYLLLNVDADKFEKQDKSSFPHPDPWNRNRDSRKHDD